jgi:RHS repeat-associated protein
VPPAVGAKSRFGKITFSSPNGGVTYSYSQTVYIYGAMGEKLTVATNANGSLGRSGGTAGASGAYAVNNVYRNGKMIAQRTDLTLTPSNIEYAGTDRLGSVINDGTPGRTFYLPYGEELTATANDRVEFSTYTRDGSTGLDYADQRFYTSQFGRFMSADRFKRAANVNSSGSWNKYSYVTGDPVNLFDVKGTCGAAPSGDGSDDDDDSDSDCSGDDDDDQYVTFSVEVTTESIVTTILRGLGTLGPILQILFPTVTSTTDTIGAQPYLSPEYIEATCTKVGDPVVVPADNSTGESIEREYLCPNGGTYTVHILTNKSGKVKDKHSRPGGLKYGKPGQTGPSPKKKPAATGGQG